MMGDERKRTSFFRSCIRLLAAPVSTALLFSLIATQRVPGQNSPFGPAVQAYLLSLDEERRELDFQLRQHEISRTEHTRAMARLKVLRRSVEQIARSRSEDIVPELEVLAEDELTALGLRERPDPGKLEAGSTIADKWKLLSIESGRPRFFVFEHLAISGPERTPAGVDPLDVIETVRIEEPRSLEGEKKTQAIDPEVEKPSGDAAGNKDALKSTDPVRPPRTPALHGPRILKFYLPAYSKEALEKGVEGDLVISATFRRDRKIKDIAIEKGLGHGLDERAREAIRRIEFEPALYEGSPIDVKTSIVFNFSMMKVTVRVGTAERIEQNSRRQQL